MTEKTINLKLYQDRYNEMVRELADMETPWGDQTEYFKQIRLVSENVRELLAIAPPFINRDEEAVYHRSIWPLYYGKLFFYLLAQRFCFLRHVQPSRDLMELVALGERGASRFFSRHRRFWADYLYGVSCFSEQFTQDYNRGLFFEPLSIILEIAGGTIAGYRVAWGLAYEEYRGWLRIIAERASAPSGGVYEWKETKSAAAEIIKAQVEAGSVYINGKPATAAQLRADFEQRYHIDLKDIDNLLYAMDTLKVEDTPYLSRLKQVFTAWKKRLGK